MERCQIPEKMCIRDRVTANRNIVAVGRPHIGTQITTYSGFAAGGLSMTVPMLFKQAYGTYDSALYVQNVDPVNTASITCAHCCASPSMDRN